MFIKIWEGTPDDSWLAIFTLFMEGPDGNGAKRVNTETSHESLLSTVTQDTEGQNQPCLMLFDLGRMEKCLREYEVISLFGSKKRPLYPCALSQPR